MKDNNNNNNNNKQGCSKYLPLLSKSPNFNDNLALRSKQVAEELASSDGRSVDELLPLARETVLNDFEWVWAQYCSWMFSCNCQSNGTNDADKDKNSVLVRLQAYGLF